MIGCFHLRPRLLWAIPMSFLLLSASSSLEAAPKPKKPIYKVGEKIEVQWHFDWLPAEVISINEVGWVKAKFKDKDREMEWPFPPDNTRRVSKAAKDADANPFEAPDENPFESDDPKESRTWTDASGKFKIEAVFSEIKDGKVHLKKADDSTIKIALEKLSASDQRLARKFSGEKVAGEPTAPADSDEPADSDSYRLRSIDADWSSLNSVAMDDLAAGVPADSISSQLDIKTKKVMLQPRAWGGDHFFESVQRMFFHPATGSAMLIHVLAPPGQARIVRIERCDLTAGKTLGSLEIKSDGTPFDVSPNGLQLLSVHQWPGKHKFVEIWKLEGKTVLHDRSFLPTDVSSPHAANLNTNDAGFIDDDHIWTLDSMGKFVVWQTSGAKADYFISLELNSRPCFSANRKYLAVNTNSGTFVLDALSGNTIAKLEGSPIGGANGRFSDDGKRFAAVSNAVVRVWDLSTGKMAHEVYFPRQLSGQSVDFVDGDFALVDGQYLVDLPKRMVLWEYQIQADQNMGRKMIGGFANSVWAEVTANDRSTKGLYPLKLPMDDAKKAASSINMDALVVVKPGAKLDLRVQCQNPQETQKIGTDLFNRLKSMGMEITTETPIWLEATVVPGKTRTVTYQTIGIGRGTESVNVTELVCRLALVEGGKVHWEAKAVIENAPHFIHNREDHSLQDAVTKGNENSVEAFFANTTIPPYLIRHPEFVVQGATAISSQGMTNAKPTFQALAEQAKNPPAPQQPAGAAPFGPPRAPGAPGFPGFPGRPPFGR